MLVFISSPYAGDTERNIEMARKYCRYAVERGYTPVAPHLFYPQFLKDSSNAERTLGLRMGLELLDCCTEMWCFGVPSPGMKTEITHAEKRGIPIWYFTEKMIREEMTDGC